MLGGMSGTDSRIEELVSDHRQLMTHLQSYGQLQLSSRVEDAFSKTLMIAAASYFEVRLTQIIIEIYRGATQGTEVLAQFVQRRAIGRQFAQLFNWGDPNANSFYILFGLEFSDYMKKQIQADSALDAAVRAFLEIGNLRNQMVHGDYAAFQLNKTVDEVYGLYHSATRFLDEFPIAIRECAALGRP